VRGGRKLSSSQGEVLKQEKLCPQVLLSICPAAELTDKLASRLWFLDFY
jgi:hypothetical protein